MEAVKVIKKAVEERGLLTPRESYRPASFDEAGEIPEKVLKKIEEGDYRVEYCGTGHPCIRVNTSCEKMEEVYLMDLFSNGIFTEVWTGAKGLIEATSAELEELAYKDLVSEASFFSPVKW